MKASPALIEANRRICQKIKQQAIQKYYENPNFCKTCKKVIEVLKDEPSRIAKAKKFCSRSCAAKYNNGGVDRWKTARNQRGPNSLCTSDANGICEHCKKVFSLTPRPNHKTYQKRRYCNECLPLVRSDIGKVKAQQNGTALPKRLTEMTKKELREHYSYYHSFKTATTNHARRIFKKNGHSKTCYICGYDHKVQVSHKRAVADFPEDTLVSEINSPENLVGLCSNHHVEYDDGLFCLI